MNHCPLCQNTSKVIHIRKHDDYNILYCSDCQLQFSNPMNDPGELFYQQCNIYESRFKDAQVAMGKPSYDWRYQTCLKLCISKPNQSLLDIGCGDGGFMALAKSKGFNVFGIDVDKRAIHLAKNVRNLEHVERGRWEKLQKIEHWKNFDIITLFDMLEHVSSPIHLVTIVFELLKSGGLICITVPRLDRYPRIFDIKADFPPHHFTLWTPNALNVLLKKVGFEEISIVEKPFLPEDFVLHLIWRTKRFIRKLKRNQSNSNTERLLNLKNRSTSKRNRVVAKLVKRPMLFVLVGVSWLFRRFHIGGGHTLLAIAKKPFQDETALRIIMDKRNHPQIEKN